MIFILHYTLHLLFPFVIAKILFGKKWLHAGVLMLLTMAMDIDHLLANPIYDANRCSLGVHPLHTAWAAVIYIIMLSIPSWRIRAIAVGCIWHLATDGIDCVVRL